MERPVRITHSKVAAKIVNRSKQAPKIDPQAIAKAFGARAIASTNGLDVFSLRDASQWVVDGADGSPLHSAPKHQ